MKRVFYKIKNILKRTCSNELNYEELKKIIKNNTKVNLIDVRSNQEYKEGHIQKAINLPIYELDKRIQSIVNCKDEIIILYCQSDFRSKKGKKILNKMGYNNVFYLKGGIDEI